VAGQPVGVVACQHVHLGHVAPAIDEDRFEAAGQLGRVEARRQVHEPHHRAGKWVVHLHIQRAVRQAGGRRRLAAGLKEIPRRVPDLADRQRLGIDRLDMFIPIQPEGQADVRRDIQPPAIDAPAS
jgi:hypothetical protein